MSERTAAELLGSGEYLVCNDLPHMSWLWGVLHAPSTSAIRIKYPELAIVESLPPWMGEAELATMRETPLRLDDEPPQDLLRALVADRERG